MEKDERVPIILKYVKDKDVLDVGCIDHTATQEKRENWLHNKIREKAKSVMGLDNNKKEVKKLQNRYDLIYGDAQTIDLKCKFDCIVAGELIEHLENPGIFLKNMLRHLRSGGYMILTTPNPFYPKNFIKLLNNKSACENSEHTCWFCDDTISQLLRRVGFDNINIYFTNRSKRFFGIGRLPSKIINKKFSSHILIIAYKQLANGACAAE